MAYEYALEKYKDSQSRHTCPSCKHPKEFTRYIDVRTGQYLADHVGRCNREAKCGYHYTPKKFFEVNPWIKVENLTHQKFIQKFPIKEVRKIGGVDFIPKDYLKRTLNGYGRNAFIKYLYARFEVDKVKILLRRYYIGTWEDGRTVFWQVDTRGRIRSGKLIAYDATTGKRIKSRKPSWVHAELKRAGQLPASFRLGQCLFGEHLLPREPERTIAIVESEKTAIVASLFMPNLIWVATGGCGNLNLARLRVTEGRRVLLFPDSSKFQRWKAKANEVSRLFDLDVRVSNLLDSRLTEAQKHEDYDIADFLLANRERS